MAYYGTGEGREKAKNLVGRGKELLTQLVDDAWSLSYWQAQGLPLGGQLQTKKYFHGRCVDIFWNNQLSLAFKTLFGFLC